MLQVLFIFSYTSSCAGLYRFKRRYLRKAEKVVLCKYGFSFTPFRTALGVNNFMSFFKQNYVAGFANEDVKGQSRCCRMDTWLTFYILLSAVFLVIVTSKYGWDFS